MIRVLIGLASVLMLLLPAGAAFGRTLMVAGNGVDAGSCGPSAAPCRSLGQAIALAADGDVIVVGPGRYGDINFNGTFGETGEEAAPADCGCMIRIGKALTIVSRDGAYATVLDAGNSGGVAGLDVVNIAASRVTFGRAHQGFTIINAGGAGIVATRTGGGDRLQKLHVEGNVITRTAAGIRLDADASVVLGNVIVSTSGDGLTIDGDRNQVMRNVAIGNGQGLSTRAERTTFQDNALVANAGPGLFIEAASANTYARNVIVANSYGMYMRTAISFGEQPIIRYNDVLGNLGNGLAIGMSTKVLYNNVVGNAEAVLGGVSDGDRCGLFADETEPVTATYNWWGDRLGPDQLNADHNCSPVNAVVIPFARSEYRFSEGPRGIMP